MLFRSEVNEIVQKASEKLNFDPSAIDKWAVHPGGKKILDSVRKSAKLQDTDLQYSYKVLSDYGNMSSPTILFVLNEIMLSKPAEGETVFSIGFGPGLSIESALLTYKTNATKKSSTNKNVVVSKSNKRVNSKRKVVSIQ